MTDQEIMQLVEEAGMFAMLGPLSNLLHHEIAILQRFSNLVAEREREACLAEIETGIWLDKTTEEVLADIAGAIRARGGKGGEEC